MTPLLHPFRNAARDAVAQILDISPHDLLVSTPPSPEHGDYAVACFSAASVKKIAPATLATQVANQFSSNQYLVSAQAMGGYVNFHANRPHAFQYLTDCLLHQTTSFVPTSLGQGKTICIDYSSPNIAKHLAYHHLRSTSIGHALANLYDALGYTVVRINHLGDWGTTHGMLLAAQQKWGLPNPLTIQSLNDLYVRFREAIKETPDLTDDGRAWFKKLEDGDVHATTIWKQFKKTSWDEFSLIYDRLGIVFDEVRGESAYQKDIPDLIKRLEDISTISDGALVVSLDDKDMPPLLLKKNDGATLYATRDLAAAEYRFATYDFFRSLYVVDRGQSLHFKQLFETLDRMNHTWTNRCQHVPFGLVRIGGKKTSTRTGHVVLLQDVLNEAQDKIKQKLNQTMADALPETIDKLSKDIGIGAILFSNLASQRDKDVDFSWEDILSFDGDACPYIQYAHARCNAILAKSNQEMHHTQLNMTRLTQDAEWSVAYKLLEFPDTLYRSTENHEPHILCHYLLDLCGDFSSWYATGNQTPSLRVLCDDQAIQQARLGLVKSTAYILKEGLSILGIAAPPRM